MSIRDECGPEYYRGKAFRQRTINAYGSLIQLCGAPMSTRQLSKQNRNLQRTKCLACALASSQLKRCVATSSADMILVAIDVSKASRCYKGHERAARRHKNLGLNMMAWAFDVWVNRCHAHHIGPCAACHDSHRRSPTDVQKLGPPLRFFKQRQPIVLRHHSVARKRNSTSPVRKLVNRLAVLHLAAKNALLPVRVTERSPESCRGGHLHGASQLLRLQLGSGKGPRSIDNIFAQRLDLAHNLLLNERSEGGKMQMPPYIAVKNAARLVLAASTL